MLRFLALNTRARRDFVPFRQPPPPHPLFSLRSHTATSQLAGFRKKKIVLTSLFMVFPCLPSSVFTPEVLAVVSTINLLGSLGSCLGLI